MNRFQEANPRLVPKFATLVEDVGFYFAKACAFDRLIPVDDEDRIYIPRIEYDLAHDNGGECEIVAIRVYVFPSDLPVKSPSLEEIARQYLQDDDAHWERACDYLDEYGDAIEPDYGVAA